MYCFFRVTSLFFLFLLTFSFLLILLHSSSHCLTLSTPFVVVIVVVKSLTRKSNLEREDGRLTYRKKKKKVTKPYFKKENTPSLHLSSDILQNYLLINFYVVNSFLKYFNSFIVCDESGMYKYRLS